MNLCSIILVMWLSLFSITANFIADGRASYYADRMHGQRTASGERYNKKLLTAAHATLPFNTKVLVTNLKNGKSVVVKINDRMPRNRHTIIDLSRAAATEIGIIRSGYGSVRLTEVDEQEAEQQDSTLAVPEGEVVTKR